MVSEPTLDDVLRSAADGIEAGLRQLRRTRPLEIESHALPDGQSVVVPTLPEMLRVKAYLVVQRRRTGPKGPAGDDAVGCLQGSRPEVGELGGRDGGL
jgi:hypothetical protein